MTNRPRTRGGEISAIYIGVTIDAPPIAIPAIKRESKNSGQFRASPQPSDDTKKHAAKAKSTFLRPNRSDALPITRTPAIVPMMAIATVKPWRISSNLKSVSNGSLAPEIATVSKPKISPPSAATNVPPIMTRRERRTWATGLEEGMTFMRWS